VADRDASIERDDELDRERSRRRADDAYGRRAAAAVGGGTVTSGEPLERGDGHGHLDRSDVGREGGLRPILRDVRGQSSRELQGADGLRAVEAHPPARCGGGGERPDDVGGFGDDSVVLAPGLGRRAARPVSRARGVLGAQLLGRDRRDDEGEPDGAFPEESHDRGWGGEILGRGPYRISLRRGAYL